MEIALASSEAGRQTRSIVATMTPPPSLENAARRGAGRRAERQFGFVFAVVFTVLALLPLRHDEPVRRWAAGAALGLLLLTLAWPAALVWPNRLWLKFGELLHRVTSPVALGMVYVVAILPIGVAMRWAGKDPLRLRRTPEESSYWIRRDPPGRADERMKRQF